MSNTWNGKNRRNPWRRMKIRHKFPIIVAVPTLVIMIAVTAISFLMARNALDDQRSQIFSQVLDKQSLALESWVETAKRDVLVLASGKATQDAVLAFDASWDALAGDPEQTLQDLYINDNRFPVGEKDRLEMADDGSAWSQTHGDFHAGFRSFQNLGGYYDLFLFDLDGNLIYSVFKEADFATNFRNGPFASSDLGVAFRDAANLNAGDITITELAAYAPSFGAPAKFIASAVFDSAGQRIGVAALQLPADQIAEIISNSPVLGETGQIYAVAVDGTALSDSLFEGGHKVLDRLPELPQISAVMGGEQAFLTGVPGLSGEPVIAYSKIFHVLGIQWKLILEQDLKEANQRSNDLLLLASIQTVIVLVILVLLAYRIAGTLTRRIVAISRSVTELSKGDLDIVVAETKTGDELGEIARALENFKNDFAAGQRAIKAQEQNAEIQSAVMGTLSASLAKLSSGDLDCAIDTAFAEEFDQLRGNFNETVSALSDIVQKLQMNAQQINLDAQKLSDGSASLSHRTESQAATLEQSVAAMHEISDSVTETATGARGIAAAINTTRTQAEHGEHVRGQAEDAMKNIEVSSKEIGNIVQLIDDIAFQTNLLALNAGVEAARAGDAGRGFTVVASEVRALAQRSSESASEIRSLIERSNEGIANGVALVADMGAAIESVLRGVSEVTDHIKVIADGAEEQASGLSEIKLGIDMLDKVTQQNAAMVDETATSSRALQFKASEMQELANHFRNDAARRSSESSNETSVWQAA